MSYILRPNNRKRISGSTIKAKIVSPDKKMSSSVEYPVQVQVQTLSDRECVIRDMQQMDAILSGVNDWSNITEEIKEFQTALTSATNGSRIILDGFQPYKDGNGNEIINSNGVVLKRPAYTAGTDTDFTTILRIIVKKNEEQEVYTKNITIPAYTADEVIGAIKTSNFAKEYWSLIKNANVKPKNIFSSLTNITGSNILQRYGIDKYYNSSVAASIPVLETTYPSYYTGDGTLISNTGAVNRLDAKTVYALKNDLHYSVVGVSGSELTDEEALAINVNKSHSKNETVAYRLKSSNLNTDNIIKSTFTLEGSTLPCVISQDDIGFLSNKIQVSHIQSNIIQSMHLGWFIPSSARTAYGIANDKIIDSSESSRTTISINTTTCNPILKIPNSLTSLIDISDDTSNAIQDFENIGYDWNTLDDKHGFVDNMISVKVVLNPGSGMYVSDTMPSPVDDLTSLTSSSTLTSELTLTNTDSTKYLYLDKSDFTSQIKGVIKITLIQSSLGEPVDINFYFTLAPTSV